MIVLGMAYDHEFFRFQDIDFGSQLEIFTVALDESGISENLLRH